MVIRCWKFFLGNLSPLRKDQKLSMLISSFDKDKTMNILNISVSRDSVILVPAEYIDSLPINCGALSLPRPFAFMSFSFLHNGPEEKQSTILF